jgi:Glycosyl hydrolase family 3 C-terminal domain
MTCDLRLTLGGGGMFSIGGLQVSWESLQPPATLAGYNAIMLLFSLLGTNGQYESERHDRSLRLPEQQDTLIQNVAQVNPRTIVVLHGSGGFDVQSWIDRVPALLHAWFPGQYGSQALAEILFGVSQEALKRWTVVMHFENFTERSQPDSLNLAHSYLVLHPIIEFVVHRAELMLIWRDGGESRVRIRENSG